MIKYKKQVTCIVLIYSYSSWTKTHQLFSFCEKYHLISSILIENIIV